MKHPEDAGSKTGGAGPRRSFLAGAAEPFDIIFMDPPFNEPVLAEVCRRIEAGAWLAPGGLVYLEAPASSGPPELPEGWSLLKSKRAGEVGYHLARRDVLGAPQQ